MAELARRIGPELIAVYVDFDQRVMRMGFGELAAVKTLRDAGIEVNSTPGLRTGLIIVDRQGYIFTPTALYLEAEDRPTHAANAMRLSKDQALEALARLSPAAKAIAIAFAKTEEERKRIRERAVEVPSIKWSTRSSRRWRSAWRKLHPSSWTSRARCAFLTLISSMSNWSSPARLFSGVASQFHQASRSWEAARTSRAA